MAQLLEPAGAEEDEQERGQERDRRRERRAPDSRRRVADHGDRQHHGARGELAERDRVGELLLAEPVVDRDDVVLHQRDDHETASEAESADLERDPDEAGDRRVRRDDGEHRRRRAEPQRELDHTGAQQHREHPRPRGQRHDPGRDRVGDGAHEREAAARGVAAREADPGGGDHHHGRGDGSGGRAEQHRVLRMTEEERRQGDDEHEAGDDEREPAHHRADRPVGDPRAVDRELRRGRPGQEAGRRDGVLEVLGAHPALALAPSSPGGAPCGPAARRTRARRAVPNAGARRGDRSWARPRREPNFVDTGRCARLASRAATTA